MIDSRIGDDRFGVYVWTNSLEFYAHILSRYIRGTYGLKYNYEMMACNFVYYSPVFSIDFLFQHIIKIIIYYFKKKKSSSENI